MYLPNNTLLQGGKYKIVRFISSGGFGNTYEALDVSLNKRVAIKEFFVKDFCVRDADSTRVTLSIPGKKALIDYLKRKFVEEARAIANMEHENIVDVKALFEENGTAYYVMDYIDGESVGDLLKRRGSLPESEALPIIRKVADALGYMHKKNRFHLDVKPANIMLRHDGKVVLIDFGTSKQYAEVDGENTTTMAPCYTPGYAPSEQMNPKTTRFTAATDVYALGATLYKMLTGVTPPSAIDLQNEDETLSPLPAEISAGVKECVQKAMIPQRNRRLQSVQEFLNIMDNSEDTVSEDTICEDEEKKPREEETRRRTEEECRREEARKRDEATRKAAEEAKPKVQGERKNGSKTNNVETWIMKVGVTAVVLIAVIAIVMGIRGGKGETTAEGPSAKDTTTVIEETSLISYDSSTKTLTFPNGSYKMVFVEGGTFLMGSNDSEADDDEKPVHNVTLSSYFIGQTEVTQELWQAVMNSNPSHFRGSNLPVEQVSWNDCKKFIGELKRLTGENFRLPTEAEWEYAARGGKHTKNFKYAGSNYLREVAWYGQCDGETYNNGNSGERTHSVATTDKSNELGIYDMSGNVWEWCDDWYAIYSDNAQTNPTGPNHGSACVLRGGDWRVIAANCRSCNRYYHPPTDRHYYLGLRLAL